MKNNFNSHADSYDGHSYMQKVMAEKLFEYIKKTGAVFKSIFEIGCGTGHLSRLLYNYNPEILCLNDISSNMIKVTQGKINNLKINFIESDFEEYKFQSSFDLIASNAVIQWFKKLDKNFNKIHTGLKEAGIFAFAVFIKGTFTELIESFNLSYKQLGLPIETHVLDFHSPDAIRDNLIKANFKIRVFDVKDYQLLYNTPLEFLKELRAIGASHFSDKNVKLNVMRKMLKNYQNNYSLSDDKIIVSYKVLFCTCNKL
jgi:malonyl-CoA O-methyltransferase